MTNGSASNTGPKARTEADVEQAGPVVSLAGLQSLAKLRARIRKAAGEFERLRRENTALAERIRELETRPLLDLDGTVMAFDEDPDELREKVDTFIATIDSYLARESG